MLEWKGPNEGKYQVKKNPQKIPKESTKTDF